MLPVEKTLSALRAMGKKVKQTGSSQWLAQCPAHDDNRPSLSISEGTDGRLLLNCKAGCTFKSVLEALGLDTAEAYVENNQETFNGNQIITKYPYYDGNGEILFHVCRTTEKEFPPQTPDSKFGLNGSRRVLYRLPELVKSTGQVFLVEGEKDVDRLRSLGLTATTNVGGSGAWRNEYAEVLRGRDIVTIPDNDNAGRKWCMAVESSLRGVATSVRLVELPGLPKSGDVSDWLNNGGSKEQLMQIAEQTGEVQGAIEAVVEGEWEQPAPLGQFDLPTFPLEAFPNQLCALRVFCESVAEAYQVPVGLPAMLVLSVGGASLAKKVAVHVRGDHWEPVNLFMVVTLPPGNRKSGVFRAVTEPLVEFEKQEAERLAPEIDKNCNQRMILEDTLKNARKQAATAKSAEDREAARNDTEKIIDELRETEVLKSPQYIGDDATPESVALLLNDNGGRFALLSPEGDVFDLMAGRYSSGSPNIGVYLKGHAGDDIRVNRANRDFKARYVHKPALTIGVAVQPDVLRGLTLKKGFRGRGLLGRFLYSIPKSLLGYRKINSQPVDRSIAAAYRDKILEALLLEWNLDGDGLPCSYEVTVKADALKEIDRFAIEVERQLAPGGDFASMGDWAGKLVGAVCRIAGIFHGLIYAGSGNPAKTQIDAETMLGAIAIGEYLVEHAKAAFFEMGSDPAIDTARKVLDWVSSGEIKDFSKRDAFNALRGGIQKVSELEEPLEMLIKHGYIREIEHEHNGPGRKPSQKYKINPLWLAHNTQNAHNRCANLNSAYSAQFAREVTV
jgi:putative DNA primase/helicase